MILLPLFVTLYQTVIRQKRQIAPSSRFERMGRPASYERKPRGTIPFGRMSCDIISLRRQFEHIDQSVQGFRLGGEFL